MTYSGYLGGRMVYTHGVGVEPADGVEHERSPEMPSEGFGKATRTSVDNVVRSIRHTAQDTAEEQIAPRLQERAAAR